MVNSWQLKISQANKGKLPRWVTHADSFALTQNLQWETHIQQTIQHIQYKVSIAKRKCTPKMTQIQKNYYLNTLNKLIQNSKFQKRKSQEMKKKLKIKADKF